MINNVNVYIADTPPQRGVGGEVARTSHGPRKLVCSASGSHVGLGLMHQYVWQPMVLVRPYRASRAFPTVVSRPVAGAVRALPMQAPCGS